MNKAAAFLIGYTEKQAGIMDTVKSAMGGTIDKGEKYGGKAMALMAALPLIAGAGAGSMVSHATSPTKTDEDALQSELHALELAETRAELERRKALEKKRQQQEEKRIDKPKRSLRL